MHIQKKENTKLNEDTKTKWTRNRFSPLSPMATSENGKFMNFQMKNENSWISRNSQISTEVWDQRSLKITKCAQIDGCWLQSPLKNQCYHYR